MSETYRPKARQLSLLGCCNKKIGLRDVFWDVPDPRVLSLGSVALQDVLVQLVRFVIGLET